MDHFSAENPDASACYKKAMEQKAAGEFDAAVTNLRRAVIINPDYFEAQYELGLSFRDKAKFDPAFQRHSFDAFRKAARLNFENEDAHNHYVLAAQQMGVMADLVIEYSELVKKFPDNALLARVNKNIINLSMLMMPGKVEIGSGAGSLRKFVFLASLVVLLLGLVLVIAPPLLVKSGKIPKANAGRLLGIGALLCVMGAGGFVARSQIH
jgi:tetratricopeptide (TPR) repeat protein